MYPVDLCTYFIWFMLYSMLGWLYETVLCSVQERRWCNRGFLISPCCPIYGVGALLDVLVCSGLPGPVEVFLACAAGSAVLEYLTALVLEKAFHTTCWDYSTFPLNLRGRICLPASLCFGLGGLVVLYLLQPAMAFATGLLPGPARQLAAMGLVALLAADATLTAARLTPLDRQVTERRSRVDARMERTCRRVARFVDRLAP